MPNELDKVPTRRAEVEVAAPKEDIAYRRMVDSPRHLPPKHEALLVYLEIDPETVKLGGFSRNTRGISHRDRLPGGAYRLGGRPGEGRTADPARASEGA